jgi:hypothetical protein
MALSGFDSLQVLSKDYCNPFSRNRDEINIGRRGSFLSERIIKRKRADFSQFFEMA